MKYTQLSFLDWCNNKDSNTDMECYLSWDDAMFGYFGYYSSLRK